MTEIIIIGGGAAGFFSAIICAENNRNAHVTLLEAGREPLSKVRISGGGRCNVTHACFEPAALVQNYPRGGKALRGAFSRFQPRNMVAWLEGQGVQLKTEEDGRMFPVTDHSATIVNCLMDAANKAKVELHTGTQVTAVSQQLNGDKNQFQVQLKSGNTLESDYLLLATGSSPSGYRIAEALGHTIEPPVPSLFTFNIEDEDLQELAGISVTNVSAKLPAAKLEQTGPLLITHWGLSGPAILKLSAWGARFLHDCRYQTDLQINWLPDYNQEQLRQLLFSIKSEFVRRKVTAYYPFALPRRLWEYLVKGAGVDEEKRWAELSHKAINQLTQKLNQDPYKISGKGVFKEEFVTCGGVNLKEVDFKTMESRRCPGLYFAGEILDIDGVTGGFNFQSAWTTAWLAGQAMK